MSYIWITWGNFEFYWMENYNTFARIWWIMDAFCKRKSFKYFNPKFTFLWCHFIWVNKYWILTKEKEILMIKIGNLSLSEAFDPPYSSNHGVKSNSTLDIFEEKFYGDWQKGKEIQKVVITQRLYQISSNSTQAWFSNS